MPGLAGAMEKLAGGGRARTIPRRPPASTARPSRSATRSGRWSRPRPPPRTTRAWPTSRRGSGRERYEAARREGRLMTPNEALATLPL